MRESLVRSGIQIVEAAFWMPEKAAVIAAHVGHVPSPFVEVASSMPNVAASFAMRGAEVGYVSWIEEKVVFVGHAFEAVRHTHAAAGGNPDEIHFGVVPCKLRLDVSSVVEPGFAEMTWSEDGLRRLPWVEQVQFLKELARSSNKWVAFGARNASVEGVETSVMDPLDVAVSREDAEGLGEKAGLALSAIVPCKDGTAVFIFEKIQGKVG